MGGGNRGEKFFAKKVPMDVFGMEMHFSRVFFHVSFFTDIYLMIFELDFLVANRLPAVCNQKIQLKDHQLYVCYI